MIRTYLLGAIVAAGCFGADLFPVAGTILNSATNTPLPHARVSFYRGGAVKPVASAITGDDGRFGFQLPAGTYRMLAGTRETLESYGSRHPGNTLGSAVIVGPDKDTGTLVFRFFPPSAISGRIVDDAGDPVQNALVQIIRASVVGGLRTPEILGYARTNDLGEYRFSQLAGDSPYYLAVTGEPWYNKPGNANVLTTDQPDTSTARAAAYASVYFPNTTDPAKATPVVVKPGQEARADFRLSVVANATVVVRHDAPAGMKGTVSLTYDGVGGTVAFERNQQLPMIPQLTQKLNLTLDGVPPGRYKVTIRGAAGSTSLMATAAIDVNGANVSVDLALKPLPKIQGILHLAPGSVQRAALRVGIRGDGSGLPVSTVPVEADGSFSFPSVLPGRFIVSLTSADGFYVSEMTARNASLNGRVLEVTEGNDVTLSITAANETGTLKGFVVDGDRPLEGMLVVLAPVPGEFIGDTPRIYQTESDGSFDFRLVRAGRYRLFAVDDGQFEYARPEVVAPWLPRAKEIVIAPRSSGEERIPLTPPAQ